MELTTEAAEETTPCAEAWTESREMRAVRIAFEKYMLRGSERLVRVVCRVIEETKKQSRFISWEDSRSVVYIEMFKRLQSFGEMKIGADHWQAIYYHLRTINYFRGCMVTSPVTMLEVTIDHNPSLLLVAFVFPSDEIGRVFLASKLKVQRISGGGDTTYCMRLHSYYCLLAHVAVGSATRCAWYNARRAFEV